MSGLRSCDVITWEELVTEDSPKGGFPGSPVAQTPLSQCRGTGCDPWERKQSSAGKEPACNAGDPGLIPGWGRAPREGLGYPLQCSRASWWFSKESACNAGDLGSMPGWGRSPGEGNGNPLQHSYPENPHGQRSLAGHGP